MKPRDYVRKYRRKQALQQLDLIDRLKQLDAAGIEAAVPPPPNSKREASQAKRRRKRRAAELEAADWQAPPEDPAS